VTNTWTFDELVADAESVPVEGWDFSWLNGRATEERPSWRYSRLIAERMPHASAALDIQTGGGEVLAGVPWLPALTVATESWPPNIVRASQRLRPRGVAVIADDDEPRLPFGDGVFDLVISRHPVVTWWNEIARVLRPGGTYLSQQVGPRSVVELTEVFLGPQPPNSHRDPESARHEAEAAGLEVVDLRMESLRTVFHDIGAVIYFLRKVIWIVPGFTVDRYRTELKALHDRIQAEGPFVAHATRFLIEAHKPA
jgi:SAM-dependent methyltransferase